MYWATTEFSVGETSRELTDALSAWADHIREAHPLVKELRCYRFNGGTSYVWQEGFENYHDYQALIDQEDDRCTAVMAAVFRHAVPGTRRGRVWSGVIGG